MFYMTFSYVFLRLLFWIERELGFEVRNQTFAQLQSIFLLILGSHFYDQIIFASFSTYQALTFLFLRCRCIDNLRNSRDRGLEIQIIFFIICFININDCFYTFKFFLEMLVQKFMSITKWNYIICRCHRPFSRKKCRYNALIFISIKFQTEL